MSTNVEGCFDIFLKERKTKWRITLELSCYSLIVEECSHTQCYIDYAVLIVLTIDLSKSSAHYVPFCALNAQKFADQSNNYLHVEYFDVKDRLL